jgi:hypothetical protein
MTQTQDTNRAEVEPTEEVGITESEWTVDGHTVEFSIKLGAVTVELHCPHRGKAACRTGGTCELVTLFGEHDNEEIWDDSQAAYSPTSNPFPIMHRLIDGNRYIAAVRIEA